VHQTYTSLGLPGSKSKKIIIERNSKVLDKTEYQIELTLKTSNSDNSK
jgi:hypothetical protein